MTLPAQRSQPHPDNTPLDPHDKQALQELDYTKHKRPLLMTAKKIRTTEAQLARELKTLGLSSGKPLVDVSLQINHRLIHSPHSVPAARRAQSAQSNLRQHYRRWEALCQKHQQSQSSTND